MLSETTIKKRWIPFLELLDKLQEKRNFLSWAAIFILLLLFYVLLRFFPFPQYQQISEVEVTQEIFEVFEPKEVPVFRSRIPEKESITAGEMEMPSDEEIAQVFDFQTFEELEAGSDLIQEMGIFTDAGGNMEDLLKELDSFTEGSGALQGDVFLTGDDSPVVPNGLGGLKKTGDKPGIKEADGSGIRIDGTGDGRGRSAGEGIGDGKSLGKGTGVAVVFKSYGEDDYQGKDIVNPLIEWMKKHRQAHEYTIRNFLEYKLGDITSIIRFYMNDRQLEMYLQVTEKTRELSIFIVEGTQFSKLVDQGISKRSHKLEVGLVERDPSDGRIVNLFSTQTSPTKEKTDDFMSVFLSWWNEGKPVE